MKKAVKIIILLLIVVVLVALGIKTFKNKKAEDANTPKVKIYPMVINSFTPKLETVELTLPYLAIVENDSDIAINSRVAARVLSIVNGAKKVQRGEVVVKLDTSSINSKIEAIKSQIKATKVSMDNLYLTHKRTKTLLDIKGASVEQYQKEQSNIALLKSKIASQNAQLSELKENLSYAILKSPVDGIVSHTFISKGMVAMPGKPLLEIKSDSKNGVYLLLQLPPKVNPKEVIFQNKKYDIISLNSAKNGLYQYRANISGASLVSGDRVEISVVIYNNKGTKLPFDTIFNKNGKSYVLAINAKKILLKEVHILARGEEGVVVKTVPSGKVVLAKPDILLRLLAGYPFKVDKE